MHSLVPGRRRKAIRGMLAIALIAAILPSAFLTALPAAAATTLLSADFNSATDGFSYVDDAFGTSQPSYASGVRVATGGYGSTGGLQVTLGGVDATSITNGMSGGWSYTLNLAAAETGVVLAFRYKLDQTATYEFDEYTRMLVKVDGVQVGRGAKNYVDHIGGDGSSTQGNSSSFLPTTDWQQHQIYLGNLSAGSHTLVLGGLNNKKDAADESTTIAIDDVTVTSGNPPLTVSHAQQVVDRASLAQFLAYDQGVSAFHDRCSASGVSCSTQGVTTNFMNALAYVEQQLQGMGYATFRHAFNYNGNTGTNICGTKLGSVTPTQMYIVSGHLDARSGGDGFNDDASGVALGLEVARALSGPDVTTDKSVRFCFWDKEEVGLYGAYGYVQDRRALQGTTAEPTWLGVIQHDMILYDHGAGTRTTAQSAYADLDVEWRAGTTKEADSRTLALKWRYVNGTYAPDYPATAYNYSTNTDDTPFHPYVASVSVRENRRSLTSGTNAEWINPYYHTTSDVEASYMRDDDGDGKRDDIELGYNAVRTTLGLVAELAGAHIATSNQAPTANAQAVATNEDAALALTLTGSDPESSPLTYAVSTPPAHGSLSGAAPNLTYTPAANYNGADSFIFTVNDGTTDSAPATVNITVTPVNDAPLATAQSVTTNEDTANAITLAGSDIDGNPLTYAIVAQPTQGSLSGTAPSLTYTPAPNLSGADSFTFTVNDGAVNSAPATVSITITPVNDAPTADVQALTMDEDAVLAIILTGSDVEGSALTYTLMAAPDHGVTTGTPPNLGYTPAANYNGPDSLVFKVNDGSVDSAPATVAITVNPINDQPAADSQTLTTRVDTPLAITLTGSDIDGDALSFAVVAGPTSGALSGAAPDLTYTPNPGYEGGDSFTFATNDGAVGSAEAVVNITITNANSAPVAAEQTVTTAEDAPLPVTLAATDPEGDALTYRIVTEPAHGALEGNAPDLVYAPDPNYSGPDAFTFVANDGQVDSAAAAVNITVTPVNDAPVGDAQSAATAEDAALALTLSGSDPDGDALTFVIVTPPGHGALSGAAPNLTYAPAANYNGPDSFTFKVNDGATDSATVQVDITVSAVNDAPAANAQAVTTEQDTPVAITLTGSDVEGDALTFTIAGNPAHGVLGGSAPNLTYTPAAGYAGSDSFIFVANDGQADSAPATVSITVNANGPFLYLGSSSSGTAGGISYADEDVLLKNQATGLWTMFIDGSDIGLANTDIDAFELMSDGSMLMSFDTDFTLSGFSAVDDSDILRFTPTSTGATTAGTWAWHFDGSDVGLSTTSEDVDALHILPDGRLLISTLDSVSVTGASGADEDLLVFTPSALGSTTSGTWAMYFDGSDVGLSTTTNEDVNGVWVDEAGKIYLTTLGAFSVTGVSGDGSDIFVCTPSSLGGTTACSWAMYWDGSDNGFSGEDTDTLGIVK